MEKFHFRGSCKSPTDADSIREGDTVGASLSVALSAEVKSVSVCCGVTPNTMFLGAFFLLLAKYSGQDDLVVGLPVSDRRDHRFTDTIGCFVTTLALRMRSICSLGVEGLFHRVHELLSKAQQHSDLPFDLLVKELEFVNDTRANPVFQVLFVGESHGLRLPDKRMFELFGVQNQSSVSQVDLSFIVDEQDRGYELAFNFSTDLFDANQYCKFSQEERLRGKNTNRWVN